jgi:hypothetical protein
LDQGRGASRYGEDADLWAGLDQLEVGAGAGGFIGHVVAHRLCFGGFVDRVGFTMTVRSMGLMCLVN